MARTYAAAAGRPVRHARPGGEPLSAVDGLPEAALSQRVGPDGPQEVHPPELGPVGLAEVELRLRALPQQEPAQPLLPRRTDHQVRVGLTLGVEVLGDVLDVDDLGELLQRGAPGGVLAEQGADGVGDLPAAAVPDGHVDQHAVDVAGGLLRGLELLRRGGGQEVEGAHRMQPPAAPEGQGLDGGLDDLQQRGELGRGPVEVVGRQQPQRDHLDPDLVAPAEERLDVVRPDLVAVSRVTAHGAGPAPVAVEHDADVLGQVVGHPAEHPGLVERVDDLPHAALPVRHVPDVT